MTSNLIQLDGVWVYGTGTFAKEIIAQLAEFGITTLGVLDHRRNGDFFETVAGLFPIIEPSENILKPGETIVLAVCNLHGDLHSISSNLLSLERDLRIFSPVQLFKFFADQGVSWNNYWLTTDFEIFESSASSIVKARTLLADKESLILFDAILKYREFGLISDLPAPLPLSQQYLADDLHTPPLDLNIIDLGACQGENLEHFLDAGRNFNSGYLLEPDGYNFGILESKVSALKLDHLNCAKLGAWEESTVLKFDASGNPAASFSENGTIEIDVVALDEFIPKDFPVNFIKMDIEGAEMSALKGMVELIEESRPHLAISAYHKPSDLWEIGNFLDETFPNTYKFYLRMYGHQSFDTILYAVPLTS